MKNKRTRKGIAIILSIGKSVPAFTLNRRRLVIATPVFSFTITFYNFEWKYLTILNLLHSILVVKKITLDAEGTKNYIDSYLQDRLLAEKRDRLTAKQKK